MEKKNEGRGLLCRNVSLSLPNSRGDCVPLAFHARGRRTHTRTRPTIMPTLIKAIDWAAVPTLRLALLDQRLLPGTTKYVDVPDTEAAWHAIKVGWDR